MRPQRLTVVTQKTMDADLKMCRPAPAGLPKKEKKVSVPICSLP